jgi:subtilisin family serine protease
MKVITFFLVMWLMPILSFAEYTITSAEYFIDIDPGQGMGNQIPATDEAFDSNFENIEFDITLPSDIKIGPHFIYIRAKNNNDVWGLSRKCQVLVVGHKNVQKAEFFIDHDPGQGMGTPLSPDDGIFDEAVENLQIENLDTSQLSIGMHRLFIRAQNSEQTWGKPHKYLFEIIEPTLISQAEFFVDNDPGHGNGYTLSPQDNFFDSHEENLTATLNTFDLNHGEHQLFVRSKGSNTGWSQNVLATIMIRQLAADFSSNFISGLPPLTINFSNQSIGDNVTITSWQWDFNNDGIIDSYEENPVFTYSEPGKYTVSLTISDGIHMDKGIFSEKITICNHYEGIFFSQTYHDFGDIPHQKQSQPNSFILTNIGNSSHIFQSINITGQDADRFIILQDTCSSQPLSISASCIIDVVFRPVTSGKKDAFLFLSGNQPIQQTANLPLTGNGYLVKYPNISCSPASHNFGESFIEDPLPRQTRKMNNNTRSVDNLLTYEHIEDQVIIKLLPSKKRASIKRALKREMSASMVTSFTSIDAELWKLENMTVQDALIQYYNDPRVEYIEPNYRLTILDIIPDDKHFSKLWGLNNSGQENGRYDADIDAPEAWSMHKGSSIIVAVIDTGVDYNHQDLSDNMWTNQDEIPDNNIDDDNNGFIDDYYGYDFVNNDGNPYDDQSHGTHCAGTIAAIGNNGIGVAGVNWNARIMALKFLNNEGRGSTSDAIKALEYAIQMGAKISNNSWGGGSYSQALYDAINKANSMGHIFVSAAGNGGSDKIGDNNDGIPVYPCTFNIESIVSVAATDINDKRAVFSNFGRISVDLGAPGVKIYSTLPGNNYGYKNGTSMATPHVTGSISLIMGIFPSFQSWQIKDFIIQTVDPVSDLANTTVSGGRLNLFQALTMADRFEKEFCLSNTGQMDLAIEKISITGIDASHFRIQNDTCSNTNILPDNKCVVGISFTPLSRGFKIAYLNIVSNDPQNHLLTIPLKGKGIIKDIDNDGISDKFELFYGLDPDNPEDTSDDIDGDGLTNLEEYYYHTSPIDKDTDNDTMPDGFEIEHQLNPLSFADKLSDTDHDGILNQTEYLSGTDPNPNRYEISGSIATSIAGWKNLSVSNATVTINETGYTASTDRNGFFSFSHISEGQYTIQVTAPNFESVSKTIAIGGNDTQLNIEFPFLTIQQGLFTQKDMDHAVKNALKPFDAGLDGKISLEEAIQVLKILSEIHY